MLQSNICSWDNCDTVPVLHKTSQSLCTAPWPLHPQPTSQDITTFDGNVSFWSFCAPHSGGRDAWRAPSVRRTLPSVFSSGPLPLLRPGPGSGGSGSIPAESYLVRPLLAGWGVLRAQRLAPFAGRHAMMALRFQLNPIGWQFYFLETQTWTENQKDGSRLPTSGVVLQLLLAGHGCPHSCQLSLGCFDLWFICCGSVVTGVTYSTVEKSQEPHRSRPWRKACGRLLTICVKGKNVTPNRQTLPGAVDSGHCRELQLCGEMGMCYTHTQAGLAKAWRPDCPRLPPYASSSPSCRRGPQSGLLPLVTCISLHPSTARCLACVLAWCLTVGAWLIFMGGILSTNIYWALHML